MKYPIAETFYSLKGEGAWTGVPMFFIRLAGCNLKCDFCDTDYHQYGELSADDLIALALKHPAKKVVITGGEPTIYDLKPLVTALKAQDFKVHLETNGTNPLPTYFDWVAVSPKTTMDKLNLYTMKAADEVKYLCGITGWEAIIDSVDPYVRHLSWLMPLAKAWPHRDFSALLDHNVKQAIDYCLNYPDFGLCMQMHKCVGIK
jgi:organic radical activating enzyme